MFIVIIMFVSGCLAAFGFLAMRNPMRFEYPAKDLNASFTLAVNLRDWLVVCRGLGLYFVQCVFERAISKDHRPLVRARWGHVAPRAARLLGSQILAQPWKRQAAFRPGGGRELGRSNRCWHPLRGGARNSSFARQFRRHNLCGGNPNSRNCSHSSFQEGFAQRLVFDKRTIKPTLRAANSPL